MGNPDGIEFTHNMRTRRALNSVDWTQNVSARAETRPTEWHKNVDLEDEQNDKRCFGTNINRNFAYHWQGNLIKYNYVDSYFCSLVIPVFIFLDNTSLISSLTLPSRYLVNTQNRK